MTKQEKEEVQSILKELSVLMVSEINKTPTGPERNNLSEVNIYILAAQGALEKVSIKEGTDNGQ